MKALLHYKPAFRIFRIMSAGFFRWKFNFHAEKIKPDHRPYIVLSNHTTDYDPLMLLTSFPEFINFVAADNVFRWGFISKLIIFVADPIPHLKSSTDIQTVVRIISNLRKGYTVGIFAEGNRSFSGETLDIPASIARLISMSRASLITYRIDGGYFTNPRWGKTFRKGYMSGRKMGEYSSEKIKNMTLAELNEVIRKDLYVNAYEEQKVRMVPYRGNDIAENLEIALYLCPSCGNIGTLKSRRDRFFCSCGLSLRYTACGLFESNDKGGLPFQTVLDWSRWQSAKIAEKSEEFFTQFPDRPIFSDEAQSLWKIDRANSSELQGKGKLYLYRDLLELKREDGRAYSFPLDKIDNMGIFRRMVLMFSTSDQVTYEIKSSQIRSAVKYLEVYKYLKSKREQQHSQ